jgi:predicted nucleic acid-binding protein
VFVNPMPVQEATAHVESWLERRVVRVVSPGARHAELLFGFLRSEGKGGNLTTDAHLAALAVESRAVIHTADTDFLRFPGVRWVNPLD